MTRRIPNHFRTLAAVLLAGFLLSCAYNPYDSPAEVPPAALQVTYSGSISDSTFETAIFAPETLVIAFGDPYYVDSLILSAPGNIYPDKILLGTDSTVKFAVEYADTGRHHVTARIVFIDQKKTELRKTFPVTTRQGIEIAPISGNSMDSVKLVVKERKRRDVKRVWDLSAISMGAVSAYSDTAVAMIPKHVEATICSFHLEDAIHNKKSISIPFTIQILGKYVVTTSIIGTGGKISPAGPITVNHGDSLQIAVLPDAGYSIADVSLFGVSQGILAGYTFRNISRDVGISATINLIPPTLQSNNTGATVRLTWTKSRALNFARYRVYMDTIPSVSTNDILVQTKTDLTDTLLNLSGLAPDKPYYFRAFVYNTNGESAGSNEVSATLSSLPSTPIITNQPTAQSVTQGQGVTFSVVATGTASLSYQWKKNGVNIPGATSSAYSISNVTLGDSGSYTVTISNGAGSVTSNAAVLTVSTQLP